MANTFGFVAPLLLLLSMLCFGGLPCAKGGSGGGKIRHSTKTLQRGPRCAQSEKVRRGDEIQLRMSAGSDTASGESYASKGAAVQTFVVGRHRIPPINTGVLGMCVGDVRRIRVRVEQEPGIASDPMDYVVELLESTGGAARLKDAL
mmetsp:Transcript_57661/g.167006  ORF Transcript_57661/g.167006 Transcript_57661/m.167006 type:complete len:147 (+) Transcript_57661:62-502(+)